MGFSDAVFRRQLFRNAFRGFLGLTVATPIIAILQGKYLLSDFRKHHRDAPFPDMPCSGVVVVHPIPQNKSQQDEKQPDEKQQVSFKLLSSPAKANMPKPQYTNSSSSSSSWFSSFPLLRQQKDPDPLRLLVVGDSLAAGVGVTKSGTPVLPEAIAKSLSSALGGRAVYWTCMGEPGLSSPQIVKELLLAEVDNENMNNDDGDEKTIDVMEELKEWWQERRQQQEDREKELKNNQQQQQQQQTDDQENSVALPAGPAKNVRLWWKRTVQGAQKDIQELREKIHWQELGKSVRKRLRIAKQIPEPLVILPQRRNTVVPDLVAQYDVAVVITGFNDLKNLIFPLPEDPNANTATTTIREEREKENTNDGVWFERDLWKIMEALKGKMRNYGVNNKRSSDREEEDAGNNSITGSNSSCDYDPKKDESTSDSSGEASSMRHHPMVVFPAAPLYSDPPMPLSLFAAPIVKLMEKQKKKLAEKYPAPVLFLEAPDKKAISDFKNKRGPLWEARSKEEVLFELTNKARLEQLETLMREYYDMWTVDVEEEEPTYTYDDWGPDIQGPLQHLHRSPLISPDNVHPSDEGYELWGRYIADGIIAEWQKDEWQKDDTGK